MAKKENNEKIDKNVFVAIPSSLAGIFLVIVILFLIFANGQLNILVHLAWAFVVIAVTAMFFASKNNKKK
jgi:hypothetical protein